MTDELVEGGPITAEKLESIAYFLNAYETLVEALLNNTAPVWKPEWVAGVREIIRHKGVQEDLLRWASELGDGELL